MSAADSYATANGNNNGMMSRSTSRPGAAASASNVTIENTAELSFPAEFDTDIQILSNAQVAVILQMSAQNALVYDMELNEIYKKTQKYVERYNTMKNPEKGRELVDELDNLQKWVIISSLVCCELFESYSYCHANLIGCFLASSFPTSSLKFRRIYIFPLSTFAVSPTSRITN